ncbi:unnamed protein product [Rhizoctonia solani]|uniref:Cytochrome P450 n=1 Tax=Rhizoctonia solani TaxID=456999 RepID=A0A8H3BGK3_9AGAM|nr:unnamed protein product [Rhizoctonia solani]
MSDIERNMETWGETGQFDPFDVIYSVVFQLIIRAAGAREISDSVEKCKVLERLYWRVEMGSTPTSILFPWVPSTARKQKDAATREIYLMFDELVKARQSEGRREEDALQLLMDLGDSTPEIIALIMGVLFVAIVNTGLMASWILIFLDQEPEWRDIVIQEVQTLLNRYAPAPQNYGSISERFSTIPLEAWENEMPVLEVSMPSRDYPISIHYGAFASSRCIPLTFDDSSFLVYLAGETHSNPDIYPNPNKFDPSRYAAGQDKSQTHAYLGWGAGRHPCLGKHFAQYKVKVICALFFTVYNYEVVDASGRRPDPTVTVPDRNNIYQARPKDQTFYVKYSRRQELL